jgi:hypothetical protein
MDNREGCHPVLDDRDIEEFEQQGGWNPNTPICVQLHRKNKPAVIEQEQPIRPVLGGIVERKPRKPAVPPSVTKPKEPVSHNQTEEQAVLKEVNRENEATLSRMSLGEIQEAQESLRSSLSPELLAFIDSRKGKK